MRQPRLVPLLCLSSLPLAPAALAAPPVVDVYGLDDPLADVDNVQDGIEDAAGGTLRLHGDFDFGEGTVFVATDLVIDGGGEAVIKNGGAAQAEYPDNRYAAIYVGWTGEVLDAAPASGPYGEHDRIDDPFDTTKYFPAWFGDVTIRGVTFIGPARSAIMVGASRRLLIEDNTILETRNGLWDEWYIPRDPTQSRSMPIAISGCFWPPYATLPKTDLFDPDALAAGAHGVHGDVIVRDNVIAGVGTGDPLVEAYEPIGIVAVAMDARLTIARNDVSDFPIGGIGILIITNLRRSFVRDNTVTGAGWYGIDVWSFMFDTAYEITGNTIREATVDADGISLSGNTAVFGKELDRGRVVDSLVAGNDVTMVDSLWAGIGLYGDVDRTEVLDNTIRGTSDGGIAAYAFGPFPIVGSHNLVRGNDLSDYTATTVNIGFAGPTAGARVVGNAIGKGGFAGIFLDGANGSSIGNDWSASDHAGNSVILGEGSRRTVVNESGFPNGDVCSEVVDDGTDNRIVGAATCP